MSGWPGRFMNESSWPSISLLQWLLGDPPGSLPMLLPSLDGHPPSIDYSLSLPFRLPKTFSSRKPSPYTGPPSLSSHGPSGPWPSCFCGQGPSSSDYGPREPEETC